MNDDRPVSPPRPLHRQWPMLGLVFGGGAIGTLVRYVAESAAPHSVPGWPVVTFGVNVAGAFVLGLLLEALVRRGPDSGRRRQVRLLLGTGFCGGFTTYSTLALETVNLGREGYVGIAAAYGVSTVVVGALAAWLGIVVGARAGR